MDDIGLHPRRSMGAGTRLTMTDRELQDVPISAMVEASLRDQIAALAKKEDRSFSAEVRRALRLHVLAQTAIHDIEEVS